MLFDKTVEDIYKRLDAQQAKIDAFNSPTEFVQNKYDRGLAQESYFKTTISDFLLLREAQDSDGDKVEKLKGSIDKLTAFSDLVSRQFDSLNTVTPQNKDIGKMTDIAAKIIINFDKFEVAWQEIVKYVTVSAKESDRDEIIRLLSARFIEMCQEKFNTDVSSIVGQSVENPVNFKTAPSGSTA
jgi:hypothetical protein